MAGRGRAATGLVPAVLVAAVLVTAVLVTAVLVTAVLVAGCTAGPAAARPDPPAVPPPPPPPAACLLDTAAMAASTGLTWTPDDTTASDTRCVYDPATTTAPDPASGVRSDFVAVDVAPSGTYPATTLEAVAAACDEGSRTRVQPDGFVCRVRGGGSVFAARVRGGQLVTVAASAVPPGTTVDRLAGAIGEQLGALG